MISEINSCHCEHFKYEPFPKLMRSKVYGIVVLFSGLKKGTVVFAHPNIERLYDIGFYSDCWEMENFENLPEDISIKLSN